MIRIRGKINSLRLTLFALHMCWIKPKRWAGAAVAHNSSALRYRLFLGLQYGQIQAQAEGDTGFYIRHPSFQVIGTLCLGVSSQRHSDDGPSMSLMFLQKEKGMDSSRLRITPTDFNLIHLGRISTILSLKDCTITTPQHARLPFSSDPHELQINFLDMTLLIGYIIISVTEQDQNLYLPLDALKPIGD